MPSSSRSAACDHCQTPLPEGASFCPACGLPLEAAGESAVEAAGSGAGDQPARAQIDGGTSGTGRLDVTLHEGDRLALGKTLLSGLALYEVLLGARTPGRRARSADPQRLWNRRGGQEVDAAAEVSDRSTAPDGVEVVPGGSVHAEVVNSSEPALPARGGGQRSKHPALARSGERVSTGTMWRWERLRELVDEQARSSPARDRRSEPRRSGVPHPRSLLASPVRLALATGLLLVSAAVVVALLR